MGKGASPSPCLFLALDFPASSFFICGDDRMSDIESLTRQALADIVATDTPDELEGLRVALLGKHGSVTAQLKALGALPADQRKAAGEAINRARDTLGDALSARKIELDNAALDARLATETIDVTLPG